ncbi:hypothetical protein [Streptomyces sp. A012304]|uniref:hypothetical protein n=1 Tax=Streptomyces sp. A012304 TaxID=375446 RepID=UPI002230EB69|nr:hypothetical protein [Streptomyces sp. A012304]GKQ39573.1 hypothetical protein ALMP_61000 [Streptomyces sp. A012304]
MPDGAPPPQPSERERAAEQRRLAQETRNERQVWYFLAYFLFGIHIIAFVMIYAVKHGS